MSENRSFILRYATLDDAENLSSLYQEVWDDYRGIFPDELKTARQPSPIEMKQWLEKDSYVVATIGDKLVGVVGIAYKHGTCLLIHMVVKQPYRRKGIGSALLEKLLEESKARGIRTVDLHATNLGRAVYEKYGFKNNDHYMSLWLG